MSIRRQEALDYHSQGRPGKIQVSPTKPFKNQRDLSLAYTPGVAEPCREIAARPDDAYSYTAKGNLLAVVTKGKAGLGVGNIGALASKPGKIQVSPTKPFKNQRDLSLAYTPGVAEPCREIAAHPDDAYRDRKSTRL